MDRWTASFSPNSFKGLIAPIWIRMPNLPLQCWDEINVCRIASMVGIPYLLDGNMFQWSRREFARVCVRVKLDEKLPLGVWIEGKLGKFYQNIVYERLPTFCFKCCKLGHLKEDCLDNLIPAKSNLGAEDLVSKNDYKPVPNSKAPVGDSNNEADKDLYGPWIQVENKKRKALKTNFNREDVGKSNSMIEVEANSVISNNIESVAEDKLPETEGIMKTSCGNETVESENVREGTDMLCQGIAVEINAAGLNEDSLNNKFEVLGSLAEEGEILEGNVTPGMLCLEEESN
ncbi:uncharacterized protein LOC110101167 [Dendrobium catenatum]|uniref:uncharacterized protein LOC110101167 n=1 Tax=Dendrobium catenatum TaxID=906689 RepID=UPI0009F49CDF|nr:uncharacterized protein LOC110101167 [Dendrobium catenatum]